MLQYKSLVQYTRVVDSLMFQQNPKEPFLFVYLSENSLFINDYTRLKIRKQDFRHVVVPITKIPVVRLNSKMRNAYKKFSLLSYSTNMKYPTNKNLIIDTTFFTNEIDNMYKPTSYRQRAGYLIQNVLMNLFQSFPDNYKKILVYSVDTTNPANTFINKKIYPIIRQLKTEEIFFDDMLLVTLDEEGAKYRQLVESKDYKFSRVLQYLRRIKIETTEEEQEKDVESASNKVLDIVKTLVDKPSVINFAVNQYLTNNPEKTREVINDEVPQDELKRLTIASILFSVSGDINKAYRISKNISPKNIDKAVKRISDQYKDDLLQKQVSVNNSLILTSQMQNLPERVENKTPEHIFNKRKIDFETNLEKDMINAFKVLENRDIPLKFTSIKIKDKPQRNGELQKSDEALIEIMLQDKNRKNHSVIISIPKIDPNTGTFRVNGKKKCLINQIVLNPISFPKEYDSKFESSYSMFHIYSKRTKQLKYLEIYMGSFKLPLLILLAYSFGFKETMDQYKIEYEIVEEKPEKGEYFTEVPSSYMIFKNVNTDLKQELVTSFINAKIKGYKVEGNFLSKDYFNNLIIKMTGRVDSTYLITNNLQNIVDPIVRQVLINQQLPFELSQIIQYMASKCVTGYVQERNDLTNQRIRNSEVLVHLAQKQLLKAYTEYREQILSGNVDASLNISENGVLSQFINLEIVQDMEYANPLEEMASITKVTPVGKTVGGIPDKQGVQLDARNVHKTYFGNIDPLDTAEGGNIGITQQLTVNAYITSARGLFGNKELNDKEKSGILSTSASMVPFVENNEGARIIMSTNQAKQMVPLKNPEAPICQSGYESLLCNVLSDSFIKRAPCTGKIKEITRDYIDVSCSTGPIKKVDITPIQLKSGSGKNTLSTFHPVVRQNENVKEGQIIAEGSGISNGTIAMGRNLSCCYMPYKGYNFEDGLVISERLVNEDKLTSLHGVDIEVFIDKKDNVRYIIELGKESIKGEPLFRKIPGDLDELLSFDDEDEDNIDVHDGEIITKSPGGSIVDIEVFSNIPVDTFPILKNLIERTNKKYKNQSKEKYTERGVSVKGIKIVFKIEQELKIGVGDKLSNRFGNKGIISLIEKEENLPRTPWGEKVDIILNPLGVIGRMNIGQIYELYCGLISKYAASQMIKTKNKTEVIKLFNLIMNGLDTSPGKIFGKKFISTLEKLNETQFKTMINQIEQSGFFPIIIPPFQAPTYKEIIPLLKKLGLKSEYHMTLPEFNTKTYSPVPFGYVYMAKLEHIGEMKLHARSTGPMVAKVGQPSAGKRREGGQRMGEGDTWSLASYNCTKILSEFFGPLSDDPITKNEILTEIIQKGEANYKPSKTSPTKDLLNAYFTAMMLGN